MRGTLRTVGRVIGLAALVVLLSGCIKAHEDLTLRSDNTVDGTLTMAVNKQLLTLTGMSKDDFMKQITASDSPLPAGVDFQTGDYEDDTFVGQTFTFKGAPLSAFNSDASGDVKITREGDTFKVAGTLDMTSGDPSIDPTDPTTKQMLSTLDMEISITFPGKVESASGTIEGNTVTWTPKFGDKVEITAVGGAVAGGGGLLLWIGLGIGALIVIVVLVVVLGRRKGAAPVVSDATAMGTASGFGVASAEPPVPATEPASEPATEPVAEPVAEPAAPAEEAGASAPEPSPPPPPAPEEDVSGGDGS